MNYISTLGIQDVSMTSYGRSTDAKRRSNQILSIEEQQSLLSSLIAGLPPATTTKRGQDRAIKPWFIKRSSGKIEGTVKYGGIPLFGKGKGRVFTSLTEFSNWLNDVKKHIEDGQLDDLLAKAAQVKNPTK